MRRPAVGLAVTIAMACLVVTGCAQSAPAPAPTPAPAVAASVPKVAEPTKAVAPTVVPTAAPTTAPKVTYPEKGKAITIIIPYAAGGATDTGGRILAAGLEKELGVPVQIVNKAGAGSQTGVTEVVKAKPDGYTLEELTLSTTISHYLDPARQTVYKSVDDFTLIAHHHLNPGTLSVSADSQWKTIKELVDYAKANPQKVKYSTSGLQSTTHFHALMLEKAAGVKLVGVHFAGGSESLTALLGGHVDIQAGAVTDTIAPLKGGQIRVLGVTDTQPSPFIPGVPTMKSVGYNQVLVSGVALVGPKGMPKEIVDTLTRAVEKVLANEEQKKRMSELGFDVRYLDPAGLAKAWADTEADLKPIVQDALKQQ